MRAVSCSTRAHGERAAAASGGLVARKGGPTGCRLARGEAGGGGARGEGLGARAGIDRDERAVDPRRWGGAGGSVGRCREGARFSGARIRSDTEGEAGSRPGRREPRCRSPRSPSAPPRAPWRRLRRRCRSWSPPTAPRATDADAEPKLLRFSARPTKRALARDRPRTSCAFRGRWKRARVRTTRAPSDPLSRSGDAEATSESENVRALSVSVPRETQASASERLFLPARDGKKTRRRRRRVRGQDVPRRLRR